MTVWIALFRGINVGGHHRLPMKELVADLESVGCKDVRTYIQSGNAAFRSGSRSPERLADRISGAVEENRGFRPSVIVLSKDELRAAVEQNPFSGAEVEPKSLHLWFLASDARTPDLEKVRRLKSAEERFELHGRVFYLHAPAGIGRSRLGARVEELLGVPATARNWRSVSKLNELATAI